MMLTNLPPDWSPLLAALLAWLLSYAVHSTFLLGAVWVASRVGRLSPSLTDTLWKTALIAGILTAGWQSLGVGREPVGGRVHLMSDATKVLSADASRETSFPRIWVHEDQIYSFSAPASGPAEFTFADAPRVTGPVQQEGAGGWTGTRAFLARSWAPILLLGWFLGAAFGLVRLVWARLRLWNVMRGRREVMEDPILWLLRRLCREAGLRDSVRLTVSSRIGGPIALGNAEICLPERAITDLTLEQQESVLAHELAHLVRRDPAWRWVAAVVEAVFFFQPLNRLARRGVNESAEFLCDDWAVRRTGRGLTLARCLVEVAGWLQPRALPAPVSGMAESESPLVQRVQRLLASPGLTPETPKSRRLGWAGALIAAVMAVSPVVTASDFGVLAATDPALPVPGLVLEAAAHRPEPVFEAPVVAGEENVWFVPIPDVPVLAGAPGTWVPAAPEAPMPAPTAPGCSPACAPRCEALCPPAPECEPCPVHCPPAPGCESSPQRNDSHRYEVILRVAPRVRQESNDTRVIVRAPLRVVTPRMSKVDAAARAYRQALIQERVKARLKSLDQEMLHLHQEVEVQNEQMGTIHRERMRDAQEALRKAERQLRRTGWI